MLGEILVAIDTNVNDLRGRYSNSWELNNSFSTLNPPNTTVSDKQNYQGVSIPKAPVTNVANNGTQTFRPVAPTQAGQISPLQMVPYALFKTVLIL